MTAAFYSDGFSPTAETIRLCGEPGCQALPIQLGEEELDWLDGDSAHFYLQAKACALCQWVDYEITPL